MKPDLKTILQKTFLLSVLLFVAAATQGAWAGNVVYHIVNKSGKTLDIYRTYNHTSGDEALKIPDPLKSPYIPYEDYKYFRTEADAQAYYSSGGVTSNAITKYSEFGTTDKVDVYVVYSYDGKMAPPAGLPIIAPSVEKAVRCHIQFPTYNNGYIYVESGTYYGWLRTGELTNDKTAADQQFMFVSENCDPYDMKIVSPYQPEAWVNGSGQLNTNGSLHSYFEDPKNDYNRPDIADLKQERFFFTKVPNTGDYYALCTLSDINADESLAYLTFGTSQMQVQYKKTNEIGNAQKVIVKPLTLYHIVGADGTIRISAYSDRFDLQEVPPGIASKVIPKENYRYYRTLEEAQAYTANQTEGTPLVKAEAGTEVYVGYHYVGYHYEDNPQTLDLSGTRWYYMKQHHTAAPTDVFGCRETITDPVRNTNFRVFSEADIKTRLANGDIDSTCFIFRFEGDDPYAVTIRNGFQNTYAELTKSSYDTYLVYFTTNPKEAHPFLLLHYGSDLNEYYAFAATHPDISVAITGNDRYKFNRIGINPAVGIREYLLMWYCNNYTAKVSVAGNNSGNQFNYYSDRPYSKLTFEPVQHLSTFHIIDNEGREAIRYTELTDAEMPLNLAENRYVRIPAAIRSPYLEKEAITFYGKATAKGTSADGRTIYELSEPMDKTPLLHGTDIYVRYTTDHVTEYTLPLGGDVVDCNILVGGNQCIYAADGDASIASKTADTEGNPEAPYIWQVVGSDPYAIQLRNMNSEKLLAYDLGALASGTDPPALSLSADGAAGSSFILLDGQGGGAGAAKFEVMAATGTDASTQCYRLGRTEEAVQLFNVTEAGQAEVQVQMTPAIYPVYHIIDRVGAEVLSYKTQREDVGFVLKVPDPIASPLVAKYYYWADAATRAPISSVGGRADIYATYDADETALGTPAEVAYAGKERYRLRFTDDATGAAVYPYAAEAGPKLRLGGDDGYAAFARRSAITRVNWGWYFVSTNRDPYHVQLASAAQYEGRPDDRLYLNSTVAGDGSVTTGAQLNAGSEYMVLGTERACRLVILGEDKQHLYTVTSLKDAEQNAATSLGDGEFEMQELILQPTLILLDRHGWEVMRKPLPAPEGYDDVTPCDPAALRAYDSPMVKTYKFYTGGRKETGYHKFVVRESGRIGEAASLAGLATTAYAMGDDVYATYDVREEYELTYNDALSKGEDAYQFLLHVGNTYLVPDGDGVKAMDGEMAKRIESGQFKDLDDDLNQICWYVKPNKNIGQEMGYKDDAAYEGGFDPYNLQIRTVADEKYLTTHATGASVGPTAGMVGTYEGNNLSVSLSDLSAAPVPGTGQGDATLQMTNATFIVVGDGNGNMRLMPRFDHERRVEWPAAGGLSLAAPAPSAPVADRKGAQTMMLHRLVRYTYVILDNSGREALRYLGYVGDENPQVPAHFQSPMAKDFRFYHGLEVQASDADAGAPAGAPARVASLTEGEIASYRLDNIDGKEIKGGFFASGILTDTEPIFVRYAYDAEGDVLGLLSLGDWHTIQVGGKSVIDEDGTLSATDAAEVTDSWLFKYIRNATTGDLDPYNITVFNREVDGAAYGDGSAGEYHYAFLSHSVDMEDGGVGLALILTQQGKTSDYEFLSYDESGAIKNVGDATFATDGFTNKLAQITFDDEEHPVPFVSPTYHVITEGGLIALATGSDHRNAAEAPLLPVGARSPLLNPEDYVFYLGAAFDEETGTYSVRPEDRITTLCGLPKENRVYVRYNYNPDTSPAIAPDRIVTDGNTATLDALDISGSSWYNISYGTGAKDWWYCNSSGSWDSYEAKDELEGGLYTFQGDKEYLFKLTGNDPYAIRLYNSAVGDGAPVALKDGSSVVFDGSESAATTFMLLSTGDEGEGGIYIYLAPSYRYTGSNGGSNGNLFTSDKVVVDALRQLTFCQAPTARNYTFHGVRYDGDQPFALAEDGTPAVTWTAKLRRNWFMPIRLEDDIVRLFTHYEKPRSDGEGTEDAAGFFPLEEAGRGRFYADAALTEQVVILDKVGKVVMADAYPDIAEGEDFDIYFKYQVDAESLAELTSTEEEVARDVANYLDGNKTVGGKLRKDQVNANWSFMVLDGITTDAGGKTVGKQYFLYRSDDGKVGWLNNGYALHGDAAANYNGWSCHRLAEWYRPGDNDAFREGRWLWTFIGDDPYNLRLLNLESAVGVIPEAEGVYALAPADSCYTVVTEETVVTEKTDAEGKTEKIDTKIYAIGIPTEAPESNFLWGLTPGYGTENTFSLQLPVTDDLCHSLYWAMGADGQHVVGSVRQYDRSNAIRLLHYEPLTYEDVNITIRRSDEVEGYKEAAEDEKATLLAAMTTGISKLYFAENDRRFVAGDVFDLSELANSMPVNLRRAFCDYTVYSDVFKTPAEIGGTYVIQEGPYPNYEKPLIVRGEDGTAIDTLRDDDGRIIYEYYKKDGTSANGAQSIYVSYEVTSDIFLKTAPTQAEVAEMVNNNDHVYFMDFLELNDNQKLAYNTGHHAYFDQSATFRDQLGDVLQKGTTEKTVLRGEDGETMNDEDQPYNHCEFKTTGNRMTAAPENLKWYFVGDPYKVQVHCTAGAWGYARPEDEAAGKSKVAANLCRFDETETNFQFVVDCVHLRVPDYSKTDNRQFLPLYDEDGNKLEKSVPNRGYMRPYYGDFYWEVVPAVSDYDGAFALRFKEDNLRLGYRNVYYYLAHDGLEKQYRSSGEKKYNINLSYSPNNELRQEGKYADYHQANDKKTAIRLTQPVKVYVSASDASNRAVTTDELSEYFGYGEELKQVPVHLQRKYVKYDNFTQVTLDEEAEDLSVEPEGRKCQHADKTFADCGAVNRVFRLKVNYSLDADGDRLFTKQLPAVFEPNSSYIKWLDVSVGADNWLYFDKLTADTRLVSNYKTAVNDGTASGWTDGLKGLHWAFIGDPYDFTILNRRRYVDAHKDASDGTGPAQEQYLVAKPYTIKTADGKPDSVIWATSLKADDKMLFAAGSESPAADADHTSEATARAEENTHWSLQMWKTATDNASSDYFLRTASLKVEEGDRNSDSKDPINQTNNYWRMVTKTFTPEAADGAESAEPVSYFTLVPYSLSDLGEYNGDKTSSKYSETMVGLGAMQQKMDIRTIVASDNDDAANDCFDAVVSVVAEDGTVRIDHQKDLEIAYGTEDSTAVGMMPYTLRRFGCDYTCYWNYQGVSNRGDRIDRFYLTETDNILTKVESKEPIDLTYVYRVNDDMAQFFTSADDALTDEFIWLYAYFYWLQTYSGSNVEVEKTRTVFDHYVYNADGKIIDEVYREEKYTEIVSNPSESFPTSSYLDTHNQYDAVYSDESSQLDEARMMWSLVGDPYSFTMKNYAQYLDNANASVLVDEKGNVITSNLESTHLTIVVNEKGRPYLAWLDEEGNVVELISFDFSATSDKSLSTVPGTGLNGNDPTGNSMNAKNAKEFWLTNLTKYANLVLYHLVMAHQHSLEHVHADGDISSVTPEDRFEGVANTASTLTDEQKEIVDARLHEFLKYWSLYITNGTDSTHYFTESKAELVEKLLRKRGTLRDFITYPVPDAEATRVGIGTRPSVPWYMKRQFCTYTMFQRDIRMSVNDEMIAAGDEWSGPVYKDENGNSFKADPNGNPMYTVKWVSIFDISQWDDYTGSEEGTEADSYYEVSKDDAAKWGNGLTPGDKKKYPDGKENYDRALELQGQVIGRLENCHRNHMVVIDMIYDVDPDRFRFATDGRTSTAWYQMTNSSSGDDGRLMNFSYLNGIGSMSDRAQHYTNDYLWAPQGDPYGFVLRSRYATVNGTGWDDVVVTTADELPKKDGEAAAPKQPEATYTGAGDGQVARFDDRKIVAGKDGIGADNAVYEMFVGSSAYPNAFVMHPTSAWLDPADTDCSSYYMTVGKSGSAYPIGLTAGKLTDLKTDPAANWQLMASAEQLLPYFDRAGYVGGLDPAKAQAFSNVNIRTQLRQSVESGKQPAFSLLTSAQDVVYAGSFRDGSGTTLGDAAAGLPLTFVPDNLVSMTTGYFRIRAFSDDALRAEENPAHDGIVGPRYVSGYRFASELGTDAEPYAANPVTKPLALHFFETDKENASFHNTFDGLKKNIAARQAGALEDHSAMRGNIEVLPADFDPSSIFHFSSDNQPYAHYTMQTQDLTVLASPRDKSAAGSGAGNAAGVWMGKSAAAEAPDATDAPTSAFRVEDIGGTAVILRIDGQDFVGASADGDLRTAVAANMKTNYLAIDEELRYSLACRTDNELRETAAGVQTTKWMLQPVGTDEGWPYNEMPLRVEVKKGGVNASGEDDANYYGTLYVPFDTRLGNTLDGAFTVTTTPRTDQSLTMPSVSQLNGIGNPQYVPAAWPVVLRTASPREWEAGNKHYVDMYLPYAKPQSVDKSAIKLEGSYLERMLTETDVFDAAEPSEGEGMESKTVMVFGVPFERHDDHAYNRQQKRFGLYTNDNWAREAAPYTDAETADHTKQRHNKYVYHNKVYYVLDAEYKKPGSAGDASGTDENTRAIIVSFDGDELPDVEDGDDPYIADADTMAPCDVYDLLGRLVARRETPATLRRNHPRLPKGVYLFGHRKVMVK